MKASPFLLGLGLLLLLASGCSSTRMTAYWKDPAYHQRIDRVYIVGVAKQTTLRRLFEDEFARHLLAYDVISFPSYKDQLDPELADQTEIDRQLRAHRAKVLLIARVIGQRTEEVIHPGYATYRSWPFFGPWDYYPAPYYHNSWSYYDRRYDMIYVPATVSRHSVITAECNLYDAVSGDLIWSAQLETVAGNNVVNQIRDFIEAVTGKLNEQGLL